jgi:hypothetical protein
LIFNGVQQYVAGFALASNPNLNAILYARKQPIGSRMAVMANNTYAQLYHFKAILLGDGGFLVWGSDSLDTRFPEQYDVEVFMPPYLTKGKSRPSYQITNTVWGYGNSISVTGVTAPIAGVESLQFSMIGGVSYTHGSNMGQRTLFPAVLCSGTTCTIMAPPEPHIAHLDGCSCL